MTPDALGDVRRCPFVRAVIDGREDRARALAAAPPDPAEPVVIDWLLQVAREAAQTLAAQGNERSRR